MGHGRHGRHSLAARDGNPQGLRDAALVRTASDALLRVSELAALDVADIEGAPDGSARVRICHSKTDQAGQGVSLYVGRPTARAIRRYLEAAGHESGALFRGTRGPGAGCRMSTGAVRAALTRRLRDGS